MGSTSDRSSEQNKENISLIWFDPSLNEESTVAETIRTLRLINDYVVIHTNIEECVSYMKMVTNEKILLVASGTSVPTLLPFVIDLKQLEIVFILNDTCQNLLYLMETYPKINGIFDDREELHANIHKHIHLLNKQIEKFSFYDQKQTISIDLSERTAAFLWIQLVHDVILRLPSNQQAKQEMINACRDYYQGNDRELQSIDDFEQNYTSTDCIRWYTRETFVYKMVNKALRTEDMEQLHTFRFYISDLSSTLAREYEKLEELDELITTVYRGNQLTINELEQFRLSEGQLISINGYFSTSRLPHVALQFTNTDIHRQDTVPTLFEIECQTYESNCSVFADVSKHSDFPYEKEVLFDLGTVFKVERVRKEDQIWKISLRATDGGREIARQYIEETRKEMEGDSVTILFGRLMTRMGRYKSAEMYFQQLLINSESENPAHIHNQLGLVYQAMAEFPQAMNHFDRAYRLMKNSYPPFLRDSSHVLRNISQVLREQGHYKEALDYSLEAKEVLDKLSDTYELDMGHCLHSIGSCYRDQRAYTKALDSYEEALNIKRAYLPENHVYIAKTLNSLGLLHYMMKNFERALNYYVSSLEMYQACLPEDHSDIANVYHNIAEWHQQKHQYDGALHHFQLALAMKEKCYSSDHPSIATTLNSISSILGAKGDKMKALDLCLKALDMRERLLPYDHPDIIISLNSVGLRYEGIKENHLALKYFLQALERCSMSLSEDNPLRKTTEKHIFRLKQKLS
ncbi:unnamed protein product [Adineta ricciae]|uniref:NAD(P)(+)--arginine ADP-ribosyltransferase n=2 Tax=Adineta ricciae TaxID=249248 RepID=A0A815I3R0_ADIRI|nr:unnamed protein product [Adineta ricciae]